MKTPTRKIQLSVIVFLLVNLACNRILNFPKPIVLPTTQPTASVPGLQEQRVETVGQRIFYGLYYDSSAPNSLSQNACASTVDVILTIRADGKASLGTDGPANVGANCENAWLKENPFHVVYTWEGQFFTETNTIVFSTCNNVPAAGQMIYEEGIITGEAYLINPTRNEMEVLITLRP